MSCKHCNFKGICNLFDPDFEMGYDEKGYCLVEEDEEPECDGYESIEGEDYE